MKSENSNVRDQQLVNAYKTIMKNKGVKVNFADKVSLVSILQQRVDKWN
jgi:hypothetical protein